MLRRVYKQTPLIIAIIIFSIIATISTLYPIVLAWLASGVLAIVAFVPFYHTYRNRGQSDPFEPIFWVAGLFFLTYSLHAVLRLATGDLSFSGSIRQSASIPVVMAEVLSVAGMALLALYAGYYSNRSVNLGSTLPSFRPGWSSRRAWQAIAVLVAIGIAGFVLLRPSLGPGPRSELAKGSSRLAFIAINMLNIASVLTLADILIDWKEVSDPLQPDQRTIAKTAIGIAVVGMNTLLLWQLGGRGRAFNTAIIALFLLHYLYRRFSFAEGMGLFAVVKVIPSWAIALVTALIALDIGDFATTLVSPYLFRESAFTPFNNIVVLFAGVPERLGYQYGTTFASGFFEILPIQPFEQTQVVFVNEFLDVSGDNFGVPITLLGELYLNFGLIGVMGGMVVAGVVIRAVYEWLIDDHRTMASIVLFALLMNDFLLWGNFSNSFPQLGLRVLPMLVALYYISDGLEFGVTNPLDTEA